MREILLAAAIAAAPAQTDPTKGTPELWNQLWDQAYCAGYHFAVADQVGRVDMLRKQLGGAYPESIVEALRLPGQCPKPPKKE